MSKDTVETIQLVIGGISTIVILACCWLFYRNHKVFKFRMWILDLQSDYIKRHGYSKGMDYWYWKSLPSYDRMLYSFKALDLRSYFTIEQIDELLDSVPAVDQKLKP